MSGKIAYCISGHLRTFRKNPTLLDNLIRLYPGDIFIHTYAWHNVDRNLWHRDYSGSDLQTTPADIQWIHDHYPGIVEIVVDDCRSGADRLPPEFAAVGGLYSLCRSHDLRRRSGRRYDLVFGARFDLWLAEPLILPEPAPQTIYGGLNLNQVRQGCDGDVFTYGRPDVMDRMYGDPAPVAEAPKARSYGYHGEAMFTSLRKAAGLMYVPHPTKYGLLRESGVMWIQT